MRRLTIIISVLILLPTWGSMALGGEFNKYASLSKADLDKYSGEQLFDAAYQAYICSFLMHIAEQYDKGQFLRYYSTQLMQQKQVTEYGKNWNDVNFPGALEATALSDQHSKLFRISKLKAAESLLTHDPDCATLNEFTELALGIQN